MSKIKNPTIEQEKIINAIGNIVVVAAPGSGKTYVLSEKIKNLLKTLPDYKGLIAISFTNKASDELKNRSLSGGIDGKGSFFGTIDRFCFAEIVASFGKHVFGYPDEEIEVIDKDGLSIERKQEYEDLPTVGNYGDLKEEHIEFFKSLFCQGKVLLSSIGLMANYILDKSKACKLYLKSKYTNIIIDEYQDSGYEQHLIFTKLTKLGLGAIAVGDINQAIYAFAGKHMKYLKSLQAEGFTPYPLLKNHRCHPSISNYSKSLISTFLTGFKPTYETTDKIRVYEKSIIGDEETICSWIDKVQNKCAEKFNIEELKKIGVLVRSNWKGEYVNSLLDTPSRFISTTALDKEVSLWGMIFRRMLYYIFDSKDTAIAVIEDFLDVFDNKRLTKRLIRQIEEIKRDIIKLSDLSVLYNEGADNEKLIRKFVDLANTFYPERKHKRSIEILREVLQNEKSIKSYLPPEANEIQIMTFHKCKGLEFDLVFHLDLYEYILPGKTKENGKWDFRDFHQDLNLHYVAITRAKKACVLLTSTIRMNKYFDPKNGNPSEFLSHEKLNHLKKLRVTI